MPFRTGGPAAPVFCAPPLSGISWLYAGLLRHIDRDHPVYGIQAEGPGGVSDLPGSVPAMAERYVDLMRSVHPRGPYHLVGWSFGGLVAHAMAVRLHELGEPAGTLCLVDTAADAAAAPHEPIDDQRVYRVLLTAAGLDDKRWASADLDFATVSALLRREEACSPGSPRTTSAGSSRCRVTTTDSRAPTGPRTTPATPPTSRRRGRPTPRPEPRTVAAPHRWRPDRRLRHRPPLPGDAAAARGRRRGPPPRPAEETPLTRTGPGALAELPGHPGGDPAAQRP
ncbi:thioesterase domain-containing protein [Streptomyces stramineus]